MLRPRFRLGVVAVLMAVAMIISSCSDSEPGSNSSGSSTATLRVALGTGPMTKNFNPFLGGLPDNAGNLVYEPLIWFNVAKPGQIYPWLAKSYAWSDGGRKLSFTVRNGVKWTDGTTFTAKDVAYTFDLLLKNPGLNLYSVDYTSVSTSGQTVQLTFPKPAFTELYYISEIPMVSQKHYSGVKDPTKFLDPTPVGTGPYTIKSFASHDVVFTKNPNYWQKGLPKINTVDVSTYNDNNSAATALTTGQADWGQQFFPNLKRQWLNKPGRHFFAPSVGMNVLYVNLTKWPFNLVQVRKAISAGIDRPKLSTQAEGGIYPPAQSPTGLALPNQSSYLDPQYKNDKLTYDPAEATRLLQQAGFHRGSDGIMQDSRGRKLNLKLAEWGGSADYMTSAQLIATDLKKIGIGVTINSLSSQAWGEQVGAGRFDMTIKWSQIGPGPFYMYDGWLNSKYYKPVGTGASNDISRFKDPKADHFLQQIATAPTNSNAQMQAYYGLEKIMVDQLPVIPLFNLTELCAYTTDNFVGWPTTDNPYSRCVAVDEKTVLSIRPK